tara:strand:+ start:637 stop:1281 length:645 start_codon:yes stop_codon:yes gene_type:complete
MERFNIVSVIPALNEENSITKIINQVSKYSDVIVINDGSEDNTSYLANKCGATVIDHSKNLGYDASINSGFKKAKELNYEFVITLDADGQHNPKFIQDFIKEFKNQKDVIVGIREKKQRFAEILFSYLTNFKWGIKDPLCGFKGYRLSIYNELGYFDKKGLIGTELLLFAASRKYNLSQINISGEKRVGKPRFGSKINANLMILRALIIALIQY